ncbi:54S ribosomal protein L49, mitochondrial [Halocaridina rubra]|uniref:Large ribosomal subunit protein mL49 n=1 Tax=Halocaridina rubra TaxID=373956 RepID=A0AAN8WQS2_HALRR
MYGHPKCIFSVMRVIAGLRRREITGMVNTNCINRILQLSSIGIHTSSCRLGIDKFPRGRLTVPESQEKVEISTVEWSFVERVLPMKSIPVPTAKPGEVMPSGWNAPSAKPGDYPYHVIRNANHMLPVYVEHVAILTR